MNRRRFLAAVATATAAPPAEAQTPPSANPAPRVSVEIIHPRNPYEALLRQIQPGADDQFPLERDALSIQSHLDHLLSIRSLPLAPDFEGSSPLPVRFRPVAPGVETAGFDPANRNFQAGLTAWLDSLGQVRAARFFVLPGNSGSYQIRFEIASDRGYRVGRWSQQWRDGRLAAFTPDEETLTTSPAPLFRDITASALGGVASFHEQLRRGIPFWRARLDAASGMDVHGHNGIAVGDTDGDGFDEIYVCQPGGLPNRLYKNRGDGALEDITEHAGVGVLDPTSAALFLDFRNTGRQDLVVLRPSGPLLFLNEGGNRFVLKPGAFRFRTPPQGSFTSLCAADYDRDGRVDLYLCSYSFFRDGGQYRYPTPYTDARNGPPNFLFRNELRPDGGGQFVDVTEATGLSQNNDRFSLAAAWCDYNGDGWPDLLVANDFGRKNLYRNEAGKFRDVAAEAGVEDPGAGMSAAWFDYDGDGQPDLYVSNMWSAAGQRVASAMPSEQDLWRRHAKGNSLFRNRGDGTFEESGVAEGVEMGRWAWSSDGIDFDNDGVPEIFVTTGMLTNASETDLESFFWRKVAAASPDDARPAPAYENGWNALSQATHEQFSEAGRQPNVFYIRRGGRYYDFSGVSGLDTASDSRAFAVTDLDGDGNIDLLLKSRLGPQLRVFRNDSTAARRAIAFRLFGTESNRDAIGARVEVDGKVRFLGAGSGYLSQHTKTLHFGLGEAALARRVRVLWPSGAKQEFTGLPAGFTYTLTEGSAAAPALPFLARRDLPPQSPPAGENAAVLSDTWLLEPVPLPETQPGPAFLHLPATLAPDRAARYALFFRYLFDLRADLKLPLWILSDEQSRAHKIYFSEPDPADLRRLRDPGRLALALPFSGRYYTPPRRDYSGLGAAFFAAGYTDQALVYLRLAPRDNPAILLAIGKIHLAAGRTADARDSLSQGLALAPASAEGWNALGAVEVGAGNLRQALGHFQKALSLDPGLASALVNAGQAHRALGNPAAAEEHFRRALALHPDDAAAANQLGELFAAQNQTASARDYFQQAIAARRDYAPAIGNLGALYRAMGQLNDAAAAFRYGIQVHPEEESFYLNLAGIYLSQANRDAARAVIGALLARAPASMKGKQALRELTDR